MYKTCPLTNNDKRMRHSHESGSALIIAVFVILIFALLGASLVSLHRDSSTAAIYDIFTTRAHLNAYSGREIAAMELQNKSTEGDRCLNVTHEPALPQSVGFHGCSVLNQCMEVGVFDNRRIYTVVSKADCKNQVMSVHHEISTTISVSN